MTKCLSCGTVLEVNLFPALFKEQKPGSSGETVLEEGEATCFYHPRKRAVTPCAMCGRFLCTLCDVDLNGRHLCPTCLETGKKKGKLKSLETHRTLYDNIALFLATFPMLFFWPVIATAPLAIFIVFRYWKAPTSIIPRTKIRFIMAFILASLEIFGGVMLIYFMVTGGGQV